MRKWGMYFREKLKATTEECDYAKSCFVKLSEETKLAERQKSKEHWIRYKQRSCVLEAMTGYCPLSKHVLLPKCSCHREFTMRHRILINHH